MKEERLMVLNLLNEGKITADEAAKLLDALGKPLGPEFKNKHRHHAHVEFDGSEMEEKLKKFTQAAESFSKDFGEKISVTFKELEPKFKKTAKVVMEKTASVVDDLAKALNESVRSMEEKMKTACEDECCCEEEESCGCEEDNCACGDDAPKEN